MPDEALVDEVGQRLSEAAGDGAEVFLLDAVVSGDGSEGGELRLLVIEPEVENEAVESVRLRRELRGLRVPVEVVVVSRAKADDWRDVRSSVVHSAYARGRVLSG